MHTPKFSRRTFLHTSAAAAAAAVCGLPLPAAQAQASPPTPLRTTRLGPVQGCASGAHIEWYGIPYGASTAGENRWLAPQSPAPWADVLDCTTPGPAAYQYARCAMGSEDCLRLNIFAPAQARNAPVVVYLHGGGNCTGSAQELDGGALAEALGCVWVAVEHRLGVFGFNCLPALTDTAATGNLALLDIALALDWVRDEIGQFGGDSRNVTLFGHGAGSRNTLALMVSPLFEGRFDKAVAISGSLALDDAADGARRLAETLAPLAVEDGKCATEAEAALWLQTRDPAVRRWLCSLEAARLSAAVHSDALQGRRFPQLFADGVTLPQRLDTAPAAGVPLLLLSGTTELSTARWHPYWDTVSAAQKEAAVAFAVTHGSALRLYENTRQPAEFFAARTDAPLWLAQADYGAPDSRTPIPLLGSFHGIFLPMLSGETPFSAWTDFSGAGFSAMAEQLRGYLARFLACGDPNGAQLLAPAPRWRRWSPSYPYVLHLDADTETAFPACKKTPLTAASVRAAAAESPLPAALQQSIWENVVEG